MSRYLRREADSFFFRRRVPSSLQARLGQAEIYRTLKTSVRRTAKARAAELFIATEKLFQMLEEDEVFLLSDEDIRAAVRHWLGSGYWQPILRQNVDNLTPFELRSAEARLPDILLDITREVGERREHNLARHAESALSLADYGIPDDTFAIRKTGDEMLRQLREYVDRRMQVVFGKEAVVDSNSTSSTSVTSTPLNMSKLSSFIKPWQKDLAKGYNSSKPLDENTTGQYLKTVELFIGLMGDLPIGRITYEKAAEFREMVLQMPANHGKGSVASPKKELTLARANPDIERVSLKTTKRHFSGMNSIWKWLIFKKHIPGSFRSFSGHSFPGTKSKKSARDDWSLEDLQLLFTSSIYREAYGSSALHWLPLISLHSGMRLEEICRLRPSLDIVTKNGTLCFDIKRHLEKEGWAPWDPKTECGVRVIPIHSWLLQHGFQEFWKSRRAEGAKYLFSPELVLHKKKISAGFSWEFSRIKDSVGVGKKTTFHSFRHTFRIVLESTDLKESHINAVMGHEGAGGEGSTYAKRVTTAKLMEVVESFVSPLNLALLEKTNGTTPPPRRAVAKKRKLTPPVLDANGRLVRHRKT